MTGKPSNGVKILKGAAAICKYVEEDVNQILHLIEHEDLPAWKRNEKGPWRAVNLDLNEWIIFQRKKYLKDTPKYIKKEPS